MRSLLTLFCCLYLFSIYAEDFEREPLPSTPDQIAAITRDKSILVAGLVNPLNAQLCLGQIDLIEKGAQDIVLERLYVAPHMPCCYHRSSEWTKFYRYVHLQRNYL